MKKILIVEDEKLILKAYKETLEREGFSIFIARDGAEAIKMLKDLVPDMILLDLMMPKVNGFEVLKYIKNENRLKFVPVLILTNSGQGEDIEKGIALGATGYLVKSNYSMSEITEMIRHQMDI
jgi:CheY-like chemotaxis protein